MKTLTTLGALWILSVAVVAAQDLTGYSDRTAPTTSANSSPGRDVTGFTTKNAPAINPDAAKLAPNPHVVLKPRLGGVFTDGAKYGTQMINPAAPSEYGYGEKYMAAPSTREDLQHESALAAHRDTGGFKLFSLEF